jgi:hypothetical protein
MGTSNKGTADARMMTMFDPVAGRIIRSTRIDGNDRGCIDKKN